MAQLRLLERLASLDLELMDSSRLKQKQTAKASVIAHVQRLLNTHSGSVLTDANYGFVGDETQIIGSKIPDPHDIAKYLLAQLHSYEPRLTDCKVDIEMNKADDVGVNVFISGNVVGDNSGERLQISGMLLANGTLKFEPNT